jgi:translation initiation factor 2 alpha subunit (eIF-2alpha)
VTTSTPERQEGIQLLQKAIARIEETIKGLGGSFNIQMAVSY